MSRRARVSTAPMAITSAGEIVVNAYLLTGTEDGLDAVVERAKKTGLDLYVGVIVPARLHGGSFATSTTLLPM